VVYPQYDFNITHREKAARKDQLYAQQPCQVEIG
jgi:hypothetical protein